MNTFGINVNYIISITIRLIQLNCIWQVLFCFDIFILGAVTGRYFF